MFSVRIHRGKYQLAVHRISRYPESTSLYSLIWDFLLSQINIWTTTTWSNVWVVLPKPSWYDFLIGFLIWTPASKYLHLTTFILQYLCDFIHVLIFVTVSKCRKSPKLTNIVIHPKFMRKAQMHEGHECIGTLQSGPAATILSPHASTNGTLPEKRKQKKTMRIWSRALGQGFTGFFRNCDLWGSSLIMNKRFACTPNFHEGNGHISGFCWSRANRVFNIIGEVHAELKVSILGPRASGVSQMLNKRQLAYICATCHDDHRIE
jgi:hypothetical protein